MTLNKIISKRFHNFNIDVQMGTSSSTNTIRLGMLGCLLVGFEVETLKRTAITIIKAIVSGPDPIYGDPES